MRGAYCTGAEFFESMAADPQKNHRRSFLLAVSHVASASRPHKLTRRAVHEVLSEGIPREETAGRRLCRTDRRNRVPRYHHHVFVCCNARPIADRPSCAQGGATEVVAALAEAIAANPDLRGRAAVTVCGCLGPCFDGPNLVVYPDGVWYAGVTADDVPELVAEHLLGGRPVGRLVYRWDPDEDDDTP